RLGPPRYLLLLSSSPRTTWFSSCCTTRLARGGLESTSHNTLTWLKTLRARMKYAQLAVRRATHGPIYVSFAWTESGGAQPLAHSTNGRRARRNSRFWIRVWVVDISSYSPCPFSSAYASRKRDDRLRTPYGLYYA